jgi:hypothetical protein
LYVYMSTKSYTLIPYQLQDCNIQSWKIKIPCGGGIQHNFGGQNTHSLE